ncbi:hypothetical protein [Halomonas halocynthiae]|uniref:hypothetical protein n=1 Tax=Halomonas halocynthiae TaxID=176290 RepID=UPI00042117A3|nr:hypothetical protein [Halomonas halocynthiae]
MNIRNYARPLLRAAIPVAVCLVPLSGWAASQSTPETDPDSGMVIAENWQVVKANCSACHSIKLVTQNHGSRAHWEYLIRWMQDTQGLWEFQPEMEDNILDYLATYYGPKSDARRAPLLPSQRPKNPYDSDSDKTVSAGTEPPA